MQLLNIVWAVGSQVIDLQVLTSVQEEHAHTCTPKHVRYDLVKGFGTQSIEVGGNYRLLWARSVWGVSLAHKGLKV